MRKFALVLLWVPSIRGTLPTKLGRNNALPRGSAPPTPPPLPARRLASSLRGGSVITRGSSTTADPVVASSILTLAGGLCAGSLSILCFSALPDTTGPELKSLASAGAVWAATAGIEALAVPHEGGSTRHASLVGVCQGLSMVSAAAAVFALLWYADRPLSLMEAGAVVGASLEALRYAMSTGGGGGGGGRRRPRAVQLAAPFFVALLAIHVQPFLNLRSAAASVAATKKKAKAARLAISRELSAEDLTSRWTGITGALAMAALAMLRWEQDASSAGTYNPVGRFLSETGAVPVLAKISVVINQLWMLTTVALWAVNEMPYYGLGLVSVCAAFLHYSCWRITTTSDASATTTTTGGGGGGGGKPSLANNVLVYQMAQDWILVLGVVRLLYWEFTDSDVTAPSLCKHFYSLIAAFGCFGACASYARSPSATVTGIVATFVVLLRMVVVYLFSPGATSVIIAGGLGLLVGVAAIGGVMGGFI